MKPLEKKNLAPLGLSAVIVLLDQFIKALIVKNIPMNTIGSVHLGDFLIIRHVRNTGVAFSLGSNLPPVLRTILFIVIALLFLIILGFFMVRSKDFTYFQRWLLGGVIGGGLGNIIDRIFRPDGVVDFIDVKFYGLFGMERWPTFNIADSAVVVCTILLFIAILLEEGRNRKKKPQTK